MINPASFKDPSGYIFESGGKIYRQVNKLYAPAYQQLMSSGLYEKLSSQGKLIKHTELKDNLTNDSNWHTTLFPEQLSFISYPYEWCFDQLRDAALLTLSIVRTGIEYGMILKDATPYNIQFVRNKPVFIDSLSFDQYNEQEPWIAYKQFCESFLFPLYLEHYKKTDFIQLLSHYFTGIPVDVTAKLLPGKSKWNLGVRLHVHLQNSVRESAGTSSKKIQFSKQKLINLVSHLEGIIRSLKPGYPPTSTWSNYYDETILGAEYLQQKELLVKKFAAASNAKTVLDLGANDGHFSKLFASEGKTVIAADNDSRCINNLYLLCKDNSNDDLLPLIVDITNPPAGIGFNNKERKSFLDRINTDLVLALALVHHLAIAKNIPLTMIAECLAGFSSRLIIEFVPKEDEKVKQLLSTRKDIFDNYHQSGFEDAFGKYFTFDQSEKIAGTNRILYCMTRK